MEISMTTSVKEQKIIIIILLMNKIRINQNHNIFIPLTLDY